jgi:hypothetical protein
VLLAMLQFLVCAVFPLGDSKVSSTVGAHVEQLGGRLHYVHDEAYCAACAARHLVGDVPHLPPEIPSASVHAAAPPAAPPNDPTAELQLAVSPRAPPAPARIG